MPSICTRIFYVSRNPVNGRESCLIESGAFPCETGRNGKEDTYGSDEAKKANLANPGQAPLSQTQTPNQDQQRAEEAMGVFARDMCSVVVGLN